MSEPTLYDKIVDGSMPSFPIWEDKDYLAFLTPFASTPGASVVIPKKNPGAYVFDLDDEVIAGLMSAAKKAAKLLEKAFDVPKVAAVFEGEAVQHVHVKLYPMHELAANRNKFPKHEVFFPVYPGYIMTASGPRMTDDELAAMQTKIRKAAA
jgi:histidine triad (HIT) family protein